MITFGELRKKALEWQTDVSRVEKYYAINWLLKGIFDHVRLGDQLALRGATALGKAYLADYPQVEEVELAHLGMADDAMLEAELDGALREAARASGLQFRLHTFRPSAARVEYIGPLGRRSAVQPTLSLRFRAAPLLVEPAARPLIHLFSDECRTTVRAVALEELAAERLVLWAQKPLARDVFDLWFILTRGASQLDAARTREVAKRIAAAKGIALRTQLEPAYAALLERAWDNTLREIRAHPSFTQAVTEIADRLNSILPKW